VGVMPGPVSKSWRRRLGLRTAPVRGGSGLALAGSSLGGNALSTGRSDS
jgi:hypothetical protein